MWCAGCVRVGDGGMDMKAALRFKTLLACVMGAGDGSIGVLVPDTAPDTRKAKYGTVGSASSSTSGGADRSVLLDSSRDALGSIHGMTEAVAV